MQVEGVGLARRVVLGRLAVHGGAARELRRVGPTVRSATVWQAVRAASARGGPGRRRFRGADLWRSFACHQLIFWGALGLTLAAAAASWYIQQPPGEAETRIAVELPAGAPESVAANAIAAARGALRGAALRETALDAIGSRIVFPDLRGGREEALQRLDGFISAVPVEGGNALLVRIRHPDAAVAVDLDRALVAALLSRQAPVPQPKPPVITPLTGPKEVLQGMRARVAADLASADRRAAVLSDGLTDTAHDMVSALRATATQNDTRPLAADVLDQGRVLMAELQLKRLQLASKYQDDFPAVTALDAEIDKLKSFLASEQKLGAPAPHGPPVNPVLDTLGAERRRLTSELDEENQRRLALRAQLATLDGQIAASVPPPAVAVAPAPPPPILIAGNTTLLPVPDPRFLSVPLIVLVGMAGALVLQWAALRSRTVIRTVAEAEAVLGLPVLRCLDSDGHPIPVLGQLSPAQRATRIHG